MFTFLSGILILRFFMTQQGRQVSPGSRKRMYIKFYLQRGRIFYRSPQALLSTASVPFQRGSIWNEKEAVIALQTPSGHTSNRVSFRWVTDDVWWPSVNHLNEH